MDFVKKFLVRPGSRIDLGQIDPDFTGDYHDKSEAEQELAKHIERLTELQYKLYAENRQSLLVILQAMDAGGKDGTINKVLAPMNPQGCRVQNFKTPTALEQAHDFLWRVHAVVPRHGEMVVFNRSHYEDVLIARVHNLVPPEEWRKRYALINQFEELLQQNRTRIVKFFLHISPEEQLKRFLARLNDPLKQWKISESDYQERRYWEDYQRAFEAVFERCSTETAPWYIIPANHKYFRNLAVAAILEHTLESMQFELPPTTVDLDKIRTLAETELAKYRDATGKRD